MTVNAMLHEVIARSGSEAHAPVCHACKFATCCYCNRLNAYARVLVCVRVSVCAG